MLKVASHKSFFIYLITGIGCFLLIPLIAMQFSEQVNWTLSDFLVMGALQMGIGTVGYFLYQRLNTWFTLTRLSKILYVCSVILVFLIIWAELAIGIFS